MAFKIVVNSLLEMKYQYDFIQNCIDLQNNYGIFQEKLRTVISDVKRKIISID